jgi:uncharacterized protein YdeI (YjbR/CyaY-like superfamily)
MRTTSITERRRAAVPADLAYALQSELDARRRFDALPASQRRTLVLELERAATPGARRRGIALVVDRLRADYALTA